MQKVKDIKLLGLVAEHVLKNALVISKKELNALASACGPKKGPTDQRVLWVDFPRSEVTTVGRACAVRFESGPLPNAHDCPLPRAVHLDDLLELTKGTKVKDAVMLGAVDGVPDLTSAHVVDLADYADGCEVESKGSRYCEHPTDLTTSIDDVRELFDDPEDERRRSFAFDGGWTKVMSKVSDAVGGGTLSALAPPAGESGPLVVRFAQDLDDPAGRATVLVQPLDG